MVTIDSIYDAAFDRGAFPALLEQLTVAFGANAAFIGWSDAERDAGFQMQFGNDPVWLHRYVETYCRHDILMPILHAVPEGVCAPAFPHLQRAEIRESIFYREYLAPQGIVDNLAINLIKRGGMNAHLALIRKAPAAPFSDEECARMARLIPHLQRAVYIQSRLLHDANSADGYRQGMAGTSGRVMLIGASRQILEIDAGLAAQLRVRAGDMLGHEGLGQAIDRAIADGQPVGFSITDDDGGSARFLCETRALAHERFGDLVAGEGATHAVHISIIDQPRRIAFDAMGAMYRLTPTEISVLRDALEHDDLPGIGDRLGMGRATARTHLHRIYDKTQSNGFAGLAKLAHRFTHAWAD